MVRWQRVVFMSPLRLSRVLSTVRDRDPRGRVRGGGRGEVRQGRTKIKSEWRQSKQLVKIDRDIKYSNLINNKKKVIKTILCK